MTIEVFKFYDKNPISTVRMTILFNHYLKKPQTFNKLFKIL